MKFKLNEFTQLQKIPEGLQLKIKETPPGEIGGVAANTDTDYPYREIRLDIQSKNHN